MARKPKKGGERVSPVGLRIVGGQLRGRKLDYGGDLRVRPMKDRVREAVFNLLGPDVREVQAVDLFAGTGALGLEAVSRGAAGATFFEQHFPTADILQRNIASLGVEAQCTVVRGNVFVWARRTALDSQRPWLVFCSPPYEFYVSRREEMLRLVRELADAAPPQSRFVVESDERFSFADLEDIGRWAVRAYPPAVVGICRKDAS